MRLPYAPKTLHNAYKRPLYNTAQCTKLLARAKRKAYVFSENIKKTKCWKKNKRAVCFPTELDQPYIDKAASLKWLRKGRLGFDNEKIILAAQDQGLMTNGFKKMAGLSNNDQCRFCHTAVESTSHLVSACQTMLGNGHYTARHNKVCIYLHWTICKENQIETQAVWLHEPQSLPPRRSQYSTTSLLSLGGM